MGRARGATEDPDRLRRQLERAITTYDAAQQRYERLRERYQPIIDREAEIADRHAARMRKYFAEAAEAYGADQHGLAQEKARLGHDAEDQARAHNAKKDDLIHELAGRLAQLQELRARMDQLRGRISVHTTATRVEPTTRPSSGHRIVVDSFENSHVLTNDAVVTTLAQLPLPVRQHIAQVLFDETTLGNPALGTIGQFTVEGSLGVINIFSLDILYLIAYPARMVGRIYRDTIVHEAGHSAWQFNMSALQRRHWARLFSKYRSTTIGFMPSEYWQTSAQEFFCEYFAVFQRRPKTIARDTPDIFRALEAFYNSLS